MARKIASVVDPQGPAYITMKNRQQLSPFVLFDAGLVKVEEDVWGFDWHPHSGVATLTLPFHGNLNHGDSGGNHGLIKEGGFQWMQAGGGIWHKEFYEPRDGNVGVMQLWIRLGPEEETAPNRYFDVQPDAIREIDNVRLIVGTYKGETTSEHVPADITYLDVKLRPGESWTYTPPPTQVRGFIYPIEGRITVENEGIETFQMGQFQDSAENIEVTSEEGCRFILALAAPSPYPIVHEYGQMHTSREALEQGKRNIEQMRQDLEKAGLK